MTYDPPVRFAEVPAPPVPAYQNLVEFGQLWEHVAGRDHASVLEIGSLFGGTLWYWARLPRIRTLVAVDVPSDWAPVADDVRAARAKWPVWLGRVVAFADIAGDSQAPSTLERAAPFGPFDFLFIDGDHSYQGVRADWLTWSPLVRPGGLVAFHDTWPNGDRHEPGVVGWVDELRHHRPSIEWTDPDGVGIAAFTVA